MFVISGPGGVGKGTIVSRLLERDPGIWLSRSWTTRPRRAGESKDAYTFVDRATFEAQVAAGGFLEHAQIVDHLYGTPMPDPPAGKDLLLEIDVQGAAQVRKLRPDVLCILVVPPSPDVLAERMRRRGDDPERIAARLAIAADEEALGRTLADAIVVNDELDRAVAEVAGILDAHRPHPTGAH